VQAILGQRLSRFESRPYLVYSEDGFGNGGHPEGVLRTRSDSPPRALDFTWLYEVMWGILEVIGIAFRDYYALNSCIQSRKFGQLNTGRRVHGPSKGV
jgi:hypothetical protein